MPVPDIIKLFPEIEPGSFSLLPVLDRFHEGVVITDARGMVLYMNDHQKKNDDLMGSKVIGKSVTALYSVDDALSPVMRCIKTAQPIDNIACFYRPHLGKVMNSVHNVSLSMARQTVRQLKGGVLRCNGQSRLFEKASGGTLFRAKIIFNQPR